MSAPTRDEVVDLVVAALRLVSDRQRGSVISEALTRVQREDDRAARVRDLDATDATAEVDARQVAGSLDEFATNSLRVRGVDEATVALLVGAKA